MPTIMETDALRQLEQAQVIYSQLESKFTAADVGKFLAIDVLSGDYVLDEDDYSAGTLLKTRIPTSKIVLLRVGHKCTYSLGRKS